MSVQAITWGYAQTDVFAVNKFVLITLCNRADEDWSCYPSIESIATDTGLGKSTVRRALDWLEEGGYLERVRQRNPDGSLGRYRYYLSRDREASTQPAPHSSTGQKVQQIHGAPAPGSRDKHQQKQHAPRTSTGKKSANYQHAPDPSTGEPSARSGANPSARSEHSTKPSVLSNRQKKETENPHVATSELHSAFLAIWNMWPGEGRIRSKRKDLCLDAMVRALGDRQPAMMVEAVRRFVRTLENRKFTPALDRWIRDGKFEHFFPNAEIHELPFSNSATDDDWRAAVRRWADDGYWPSTRLGPAPNQVGYRGPIKPLEDLLPSLGDHPAAREIRSTINLRASA